MKKKTKIELADHNKIDELQPYVDKVLKALGHTEALVTDESLVSDFLDIFDKERRVKQAAKAKKKLGVDLFPGDYLWEVAERIKK